MFFKKRNKYTITCLRCLVFMCCLTFWFPNFVAGEMLMPSVLFTPRLCPSQAAQSMNALNKWEGSRWFQHVTWLEQSGQHSVSSRNGVLRTWTWQWVSEKSREEIKSSFPLCFPLSMHTCLKFYYPGSLLIFAEMNEGKSQLKPIHHIMSTNHSSFITKE